jgi:hypothetical protein
MTMRTWLESIFIRHDPAPARESREQADARRMPAWRAAGQGKGSGTLTDAFAPANANANLDTLKFHLIDTSLPNGSRGR